MSLAFAAGESSVTAGAVRKGAAVRIEHSAGVQIAPDLAGAAGIGADLLRSSRQQKLRLATGRLLAHVVGELRHGDLLPSGALLDGVARLVVHRDALAVLVRRTAADPRRQADTTARQRVVQTVQASGLALADRHPRVFGRCVGRRRFPVHLVRLQLNRGHAPASATPLGSGW